jgi:DNA-binding NarL/FixJ family response regulator
VTESQIRVAIISTDIRFRDRLREALAESGKGFRIAQELALKFADFGEEQIRALRHAATDLLLVDLEDDPDVGVKLIQFLAESHPGQRVLAFGPSLSSSLLLGAMRAGVSDYLQKPVEPDALAAALQRVIVLMGRATEAARKPGQV